jgi:hypothetical protein
VFLASGDKLRFTQSSTNLVDADIVIRVGTPGK